MKSLLTIFVFLFFNKIATSQNIFIPDSTFGNNGVYIYEHNYDGYIFNWNTYFKDDRIIISGLNINNSNYTTSAYFTSINSFTGDLDPFYGNSGSLNLNYEQENAYPTFTLPLKEGGFLVFYDDFNTNLSIEKAVLSIITPEGKLDTTFGESGYLVLGDFAEIGLSHFTEIEDGFIGFFEDQNDFNTGYLRKFNRQGVFDDNFGNEGKAIFSVLENTGYLMEGERFIDYKDGNIIVGYTGDNFLKSRMEVVKFDTLGNQDMFFGSNGKFILDSDPFIILYGLQFDLNNDIITSYIQDDANHIYQTGFLKIKSDGTIDNDFVQNGIFRPTVSDTARFNYKTIIDQDNNYVFFIADAEISDEGFSIFKCNSAGNPHEGFGINGYEYVNPDNSNFEGFTGMEFENDSTFYTIGITFATAPENRGFLTVRKFILGDNLLNSEGIDIFSKTTAYISIDQLIINTNFTQNELTEIKLIDMSGKTIQDFGKQSINYGQNTLSLTLKNNILSSYYVALLQTSEGQKALKVFRN